jgi:hypothetical protein
LTKCLIVFRPSGTEYRARQIASSSAYNALDDDDEPSSSATYRRIPLSASSSTSYMGPTPRYPLHTPSFKRVDFDDIVEDSLRDRKPAWRELQDGVKDSYHKVSF